MTPLAIPAAALERASRRRDAMIDAVIRGDLPRLQHLSDSWGEMPAFVQNATYRVALYAVPAQELLALDPSIGVDAFVRAYVSLLQGMTIREFVGIYHGAIAFGSGTSALFHVLEGEGAPDNAVVARGDVLAFERVTDA